MQIPFQRKILIILLLLSFIIFTICLIPYSILLSFLFFSLILCIYMKFEFQEIKRTGLFPYMPENFKQILLTRSLFDILCDVWYIPSFSVYLKIFIRPFIYQIKPEEAIENLSELSKTQRDKALEKGVINLLPKTLQCILIPNIDSINRDSNALSMKMIESEKKEDTKGNHDNESIISQQSTLDGSVFEKKIEEVEEDEKVYLLKPEPNRYYDKRNCSNLSQNCQNNNYVSVETDCIASRMNRISFFDFDKEEVENKRFCFELFEQSDNELSQKMQIKYNKPKKSSIVNSSYVVADKNSLKKEEESLRGMTFKSFTTKVLNSSKKIAQINLMEQMKKACEKSRQKWDRLENFLENKFHSKNTFGDQNLKPAFRIPLSLIKKFQSMKISGLNIKKQPLIKLFLGSNFLLGLLFVISKRSRGWLIYSFLAMFYALGFIASTGSLVCFLVKYIWQKKGNAIKEEEKKT